ncbi:MAG TPA: protein kinase, partial [Nannocystis exedens]|nr:protein kinase [Nannocystis exedens]
MLVDMPIDLLDDHDRECRARSARPCEIMDNLGLTATQAEGTDLGSSAPSLVGGSTIGRYVVLHVLGEGAMGQVYAAYDVQLDRKVAIKVLRAELVSTSVRERTLREAKALAKLSHPNVVQVYEVGDHREQLFLVLEYVQGADLRQWLKQEKHSWRQIVEVVTEVGRGLQAA